MQIRSYRHVKKFIRTWLNDVGFMTRVTCRLTAKSQDQLRNPTLGNRVWATFFAWTMHQNCASNCGGQEPRIKILGGQLTPVNRCTGAHGSVCDVILMLSEITVVIKSSRRAALHCLTNLAAVRATVLQWQPGFHLPCDVQGPDLQNILRQSYDYLAIMP